MRRLPLFLALLMAAFTSRAEPALDPGRLARTASDLAALPHRLAGTAEGHAAGDRILAGLKEAGIPGDLILEQPFEVTQLRLEPGDCYFETDAGRIPLQPLRPNVLALPVTPPEGLAADTVYLGDGSPSAFEVRMVRDRIAVLDYNCGERWLDAVRAGAAAVLFVGEETGTTGFDEGGAKYIQTSFDLPRFFVTRETARANGLLAGARIRLVSRMGFQRTAGRNLFVLLPPRDAPASVSNEFVLLACAYDSFGPLPFASRQVARAANAAALVEAAAALLRDPLPRPVVIAFFDNEAQQQAGQYRFHFSRDAFAPDNGSVSLDGMLEDRAAEKILLEAKLAALTPDVLAGRLDGLPPAAQAVRQDVLNAAELLYNRSVYGLSEARRELNLLDRQVDRLKQRLSRHQKEAARLQPAEASAEEARLKSDLARAEAVREAQKESASRRVEEARLNKETLYKARKALVAGGPPGSEPETAAACGVIVSNVAAGWQSRLEEQAAETERLLLSRSLAARLSGRKPVAMIYWNIQPSDRRWTALGPDSTPDSIANLQLTRWIKSYFDKVSAGNAGLIAGLESPQAAGIGGRVSFVLELGTLGAAPAGVLPPAEPPLDLPAFADHAGQALAFCRELARQPELSKVRVPARLNGSSLVFNVPRWTDAGRYDGCFVRFYDEKAKAGAPAADAPVFIQARKALSQPPPADAWGGTWASSSKAGTFPILFPKSPVGIILQSALLDGQGRIDWISQRHPDGTPGAAGNWEMPSWFYQDANNQIVLSEVRTRIRLTGVRAPTGPVLENTVKFMDASSASKPKRLNLGLAGDLLAIYAGRIRASLIMQGSQLLINATAAEPAGTGYEPEPGIGDALARSARDVWQLDESRLNNLRRHNILENALERLHARAEQLLDQADRETGSPARAAELRMASLACSYRVYGPVRTVTNDLIKAVIILLLLAIPFSFAFERVVSGTPNIYLQIAGFAATFGGIFTILYFVHPAFRFTSFPLVVLLAFIIIILSSLVIALMWSKFEYEVRKLHGVATASHQSTRTAQGTFSAAIALGIATMRRRPLRTALTALTILLLTFTILFFGSFKSEAGIRLILVGPGPEKPMVEIGSAPGKSFDPQSVAMLRGLFADECPSYARAWTAAGDQRVLAGRLPGDAVFTAAGFATLPPQDLDVYPKLKQALAGDLDGFRREGGLWLPAPLFEAIPEALRRPGADGAPPRVDFEGRSYTLRGSFDPASLKAVRTLDGAAFVPPDLVEVKRQLEIDYPRDADGVKLKLEEMDLADLPLIDPARAVLLWEPAADRLAMAAQSVVFLPKTEAQARRIAGEATLLMDRRASLAAGGEHRRALYAGTLALGGFAKVVVPLILGGLIIFGTMLSSVSDRQKEIFTFSALGLGPRHVAALFFAEASVYAVIGGMGGYLFAHAFAKLMEALARLGWTEAPAMNHSSMNAMLTLLIVMATVLVSTIYPAIKASRSANPGAQRQWKMPEPEGDKLALDFPFTVSAYDAVGLVSFLEEHLLAHKDKSIGLFAADEVKVAHGDGRFTIGARLWLQPFDQGVSQAFTLRTEPGPIPGIDRVHVEMKRLSGSPSIWRRSTRAFIHDLRNQFILWRTIPDEAAEHYHRLTATRFTLKPGADS